jgi:hypothetical protein
VVVVLLLAMFFDLAGLVVVWLVWLVSVVMLVMYLLLMLWRVVVVVGIIVGVAVVVVIACVLSWTTATITNINTSKTTRVPTTPTRPTTDWHRRPSSQPSPRNTNGFPPPLPTPERTDEGGGISYSFRLDARLWPWLALVLWQLRSMSFRLLSTANRLRRSRAITTSRNTTQIAA